MSNYSAARDLDLNNKKRWYVVANRAGAVFYSDGDGGKFHFIARLENEKGRLTESELDSDKPGKGFSSGGGGTIHHGLDRRSKHHEAAAKDFAGRIAVELEAARREDRFSELVLVAEPHFLGLLREALKPETKRAVRHEVRREYAQGSDAELRAQIIAAIESGK